MVRAVAWRLRVNLISLRMDLSTNLPLCLGCLLRACKCYMRRIRIFYGLVGKKKNSAAIPFLEILMCHKQCLFLVSHCSLQSASFFILLSLVIQDMNRTETIDTEGHFRLD